MNVILCEGKANVEGRGGWVWWRMNGVQPRSNETVSVVNANNNYNYNMKKNKSHNEWMKKKKKKNHLQCPWGLDKI